MKRQVEKLQDHARIVDEIADALLEGQVEMLQEIAELREINAELLDALESLLTQAQQYDHVDEIIAARAAIARARGK